MSTESGIPDFRSPGGIWEKADLNAVATPQGLARDPETFLSFYRTLLEDMREVKPNTGHRLIAEWESAGLVTGVATQNIDFLHQQAGSRMVLELHGNMRTARCTACSRQYPSDTLLSEWHCEACRAWLRPEIVLFHEPLPEETFQKAFDLALSARTFVVLGSSLQVSPANQLPLTAVENGASLIIVNRTSTHLDSRADLVIQEGIGATLERTREYLDERQT
jgi:NAD-dependent deacetylase